MAYQPPRLMKPENYCTSCSKGYLMANFSGGRCGLCQRLHDIKPVRGSVKEKAIKECPQCGSCGRVYKNLEGDTCAPCLAAQDESLHSSYQYFRTQAHGARQESTGTHHFAGGSLSSVGPPPPRRSSNLISGRNTVSIFVKLQGLRYATGRRDEISQLPDRGLFTTVGLSFPETQSFRAVVLALWSRFWEGHWKSVCAFPIDPIDDCTHIWGKAYTGVAVKKWLFDPRGSQMLGLTQGPPRPLTLGEILAYGGNAEHRNRLLVAADVQARNVSFSVLVDAVKIFRDHEAQTNAANYISRVALEQPAPIAADNSQKRGRADTVGEPGIHGSPSRKIIRSGPRSSEGNDMAYYAGITKTKRNPEFEELFRKIYFHRGQILINGGWFWSSKEEKEGLEGWITSEVVNKRGRTKDVYLLDFEDKLYAAKKIRKVLSQQHGPRTCSGASKENGMERELIEGEVYRSHILRILVEDFLAHAKACDTPVYNISAAKTFILYEAEEAGASKAIDIYLCEPYISLAKFTKFSGSSFAGSNEGLQGQTIDALAHYSVIATMKQVVLADLQGLTETKLDHGTTTSHCVLFDTMAHFNLKEGSYPIAAFHLLGDTGSKGIDTFLEGHQCNTVCERLALHTLQATTDPSQRGPTTLSRLVTMPHQAEQLSEEGEYVVGEDEEERDPNYPLY